MITSGAIDRALETQKAKKDLKEECRANKGTFKNGKCELPEEGTVAGNYQYFKAPANDLDGNICATTSYAELANTENKDRIMPDQCYRMVQKASCPKYIESYKTDKQGKCLDLDDVDKKSNRGVVSKQECERCIQIWNQREQCAKEAEQWCRANGYIN